MTGIDGLDRLFGLLLGLSFMTTILVCWYMALKDGIAENPEVPEPGHSD